MTACAPMASQYRPRYKWFTHAKLWFRTLSRYWCQELNEIRPVLRSSLSRHPKTPRIWNKQEQQVTFSEIKEWLLLVVSSRSIDAQIPAGRLRHLFVKQKSPIYCAIITIIEHYTKSLYLIVRSVNTSFYPTHAKIWQKSIHQKFLAVNSMFQ